ncbi:MAG: lytic transglycosylase domain-containing protein [Thermoanaerobaculia bacterium]|nr:MAG: lytic transglycosylase domain-containing protein [Thermoanaerobaculia bacterium]
MDHRHLLALVLAAALAAPAFAGKVEISVRQDGVRVMKNEPAESRARRLAQRFVEIPDGRLADLIERWAFERDLDPQLVRAVVQVESGYNPRALSNKGAMGLMQLMPATARELDVADPWNPEQNVRGGTAYLRRMLDRFGELDLALAAYNAGPEAVLQHAGVPPFAETRDYVRKIFCLLDGGCSESRELDGRPVKIERGPDNRIRLTTTGAGG